MCMKKQQQQQQSQQAGANTPKTMQYYDNLNVPASPTDETPSLMSQVPDDIPMYGYGAFSIDASHASGTGCFCGWPHIQEADTMWCQIPGSICAALASSFVTSSSCKYRPDDREKAHAIVQSILQLWGSSLYGNNTWEECPDLHLSDGQEDDNAPDADKEPTTKKSCKARTKRKRGNHNQVAEEGQPKKVHYNNYTKWALKVTVLSMIQNTRAFFGICDSQPFFEEGTKTVRGFRMRNDTPGVAFAALFATIQLCGTASAHGYTPAFLPLEPKNQRDARRRPDAAVWKAAENKEFDILFNKGAFEEIDRPQTMTRYPYSSYTN
jgi:hypothetical protein